MSNRMRSSEYFKNVVLNLELTLAELSPQMPMKRLICLGIGSFINSSIALHQLAFILELRKYLKVDEALFFDPILCDTEKTILERVQCKAMQNNCEGKYLADVLTLFFLPHCSTCLTNNLLWRNWKPTLLPNIILINNSFMTMRKSNPERILRFEAEYIFNAFDYAKEWPLLNNYWLNNVFNDLSIHIFPNNRLPSDNCDIWIGKSAPVYIETNAEMHLSQNFEKISLK